MKRKFIPLLFILPLLTSCPGGSNNDNVPEIDESYTPILPTYKNKNEGDIKKDENYAYLDIYEISDFHGAVASGDKELGINKLSTWMDKKRENNPGGTILISGGDMWQGSADSNLTKGNFVTYAMNVMNFDSMTFGNHEFDWTVKWINNNKNRAKFPFLGANIVNKGTSTVADFAKASTIVNRGDYKIGIIGTIGDNIKNSIIATAVEDYDFANEITTVKTEASRLRNEENCDVVIWSSHNDASYIKSRTPSDLGVDAIFGGHSHTSYAEVSGDNVPFVQTEAYSHSIGHTQLKINLTDKDVSLSTYETIANPVSDSASLIEDSDIKGIYDQYLEKYINPVKTRRVGEINAKFAIKDTLGNFAVYAMKEELTRHDEYKNYAVSSSWHNRNGGVRKDIEAGEVTYGQVYESFPFDNEIVLLKISGKELLNKFFNGNNNVAVWHSINRNEVVSTNEYYTITTDYLYLNSDFYAGVDGEVIYTGITVRDSVTNQIKNDSPVDVSKYKSSVEEFKK